MYIVAIVLKCLFTEDMIISKTKYDFLHVNNDYVYRVVSVFNI